jgi:hypothetical protein
MCPSNAALRVSGRFKSAFDDFVGEFAMLVWIAAQSAYLEWAAGLQRTYYCASLLSRCADLVRVTNVTDLSTCYSF